MAAEGSRGVRLCWTGGLIPGWLSRMRSAVIVHRRIGNFLRMRIADAFHRLLFLPLGKLQKEMRFMKQETIFQGVATALITPLDEKGVDYEAFGRLIDWQITRALMPSEICQSMSRPKAS